MAELSMWFLYGSQVLWVSISPGEPCSTLCMHVYKNKTRKFVKQVPDYFTQFLAIREPSAQFWREKAICCVGSLRDYILTICSSFTDFRTCIVIATALWFKGPFKALAWVANKRNGFTQLWLLWNNVRNNTEMWIINTGVEPLRLSADVSANFKHTWDSVCILLAQVAGYNKVYQIIW